MKGLYFIIALSDSILTKVVKYLQECFFNNHNPKQNQTKYYLPMLKGMYFIISLTVGDFFSATNIEIKNTN